MRSRNTMASKWAHRKGIARLLNSRSSSMDRMGGSCIECVGPLRIAIVLALYALRHDPLVNPDWDTVRFSGVQRVSRFRYRFELKYRRL